MGRVFWLLGLSVLMFCSCSSENYNSSDFLAGEAFTDSNMRVVLIDTISAAISTMKFDSIVTSESSRILVGRYNDPEFGTVQSSSYMALVPSTFTIDSEAEYDSIALYMKFDTYYYNDTLQTNTLHVKRLSSTLKPQEGDYLYNVSEAAYYEEDIGLSSYQPRPLDSDTLEILLSDELGMDLFEKFQEKEITTADQFRDYFKGIALIPDQGDDGSVIGFSKTSDATFVRLYYSEAEETERVQSYLDINLDEYSSTTPFFNQIISENPNEYLQLLTDQEINLSSEDTDNLSYVQSGIGIATRIEFPYIKNIYDIKGQGTILDAVLKIKPLPGSYDDNLILKDTLSVYVVDQNNDLTSQLLIAETTAVTGILNRDNEEFNDIYYEFSLGNYIEDLFTTELETEEALILLPNDYNSAVDRFILNGMDGSEYSAVLELTFAIYDEEDD
ncbi:MAG: hypothetical protein CMH46_13735 [Muricauda sp.]|nr:MULTISPECIES: DUF4270 family protein [unclassified Allomuricauda]MAU16587.1 hypothetical protein [Allomuricauda sp.]